MKAVAAGLLITPILVIGSTPNAAAESAQNITQQNVTPTTTPKEPVELLGAATESTRYWRYPDGRITTEMWTRPVRVKKQGLWAWIDTTLSEQEGVIRPKVIKGDLSLKGASTTFSPTPGQSIALTWPTDLPKPELKGNRATYTDAAGPGADLVVAALPMGFRYDVVLRRRPAKDLKIQIPVNGDGLTMRKASNGQLRVTNAEDKYVAVAPKPTLHDKESARSRSAKSRTVKTTVLDESGRQTLILEPDTDYLTDPATAYPVTIQSAFSITPTADADVWSVLPNDPNPTGETLKAGTEADGAKSRSFLKFDVSPLVGQGISNATLSLLNIDGPSCGTTVGDGIQVRRVTSAWSPSTVTWNSQPSNTTENAVTNRSSIGGSCDPAPMTWDITPIARQWADDIGNYGVVLMSPTESRSANYRVYPSVDNTMEMDPPKLTTTFAPAAGPAVVNPAGADGVEVFTAPTTWGITELQKAEAQAHALGLAEDRVSGNSSTLAPPYLDMISGQIIIPAAAAEGRDIGSAALAGTAYLSGGLVDWTLPGAYEGDEIGEDGDGPAGLTEDYTFTPQTPDAVNSSSRLNTIADEVLTLDAAQLPGSDAIFAARVWPERNQVIVRASAVTSELRQALAARYGTTTVSVWLSPNVPRPAPAIGSDNVSASAADAPENTRQNDDVAVNGGSVFRTERGQCTTGFSWGGTADEFMITAGHCLPQNKDPWMYENDTAWTIMGGLNKSSSTYDSTWMDGTGSVKLPGQPTTYGDSAQAVLIGSHKNAPSIFVGSSTSGTRRSVAGRWSRRAQDGDLYCSGGARTGQSCNWKVAGIGWRITNDEGEVTKWTQRGVRGNRCLQKGDSGGPVYTIRSGDGYVTAKGILSWAAFMPDGSVPGTDCEAGFTDIHDVVLAFGDRIAKRK
ncbi:DNRLRE domain-containing protein [Nonomuraea wenchangensis]|uniref:DNRLRE domain-containing protein n=1 Tax=Nonomuraea wenchangensis TaxID=568860 RepID=UPI003410AF55